MKNPPPMNESGPVVEFGLINHILPREGGFDNGHKPDRGGSKEWTSGHNDTMGGGAAVHP